MRFNSLNAYPHFLCHFQNPSAAANEGKDFQFPVSERLSRRREKRHDQVVKRLLKLRERIEVVKRHRPDSNSVVPLAAL